MPDPYADILSAAAVGAPPPSPSASPEDRVRLIAARSSVPLGVANDYLKVTQVESGHNVNVGSSAKGARGFGQVMPDIPGGRIRTVGGRKYDLSDPDQNIAAGLAYFHEGGSDPVARRLHYFGGPGASNHYQRTGKIPNISDGNMTAAQYVKATGGNQTQDPYGDVIEAASGETAPPSQDPYGDVVDVASGAPAQVSHGAYMARAQELRRAPDRGFPQSPTVRVPGAVPLTPRILRDLSPPVGKGVNRSALGIDPATRRDTVPIRVPSIKGILENVRGLDRAVPARVDQLRPKIEQEVRAERAAANRPGVIPQEMINEPGYFTEENIQKEIQRRATDTAQAQMDREQFMASLTPEEHAQIKQDVGDVKSGVAQGPRLGVMTLGSGVLRHLAGAAKVPELVASKISGPEVKGWMSDYLKRKAEQGEVTVEQIHDDFKNDPSKLRDISEFLTTLVGGIGEAGLAASVAGPVAGFAAMGASEAAGRDKPASDVLKAGAQGAAMGSVFKSVGGSGTGKLTAMGGIGAGTYAVEKAGGASEKDALKAAATNALLHGVMSGRGEQPTESQPLDLGAPAGKAEFAVGPEPEVVHHSQLQPRTPEGLFDGPPVPELKATDGTVVVHSGEVRQPMDGEYYFAKGKVRKSSRDSVPGESEYPILRPKTEADNAVRPTTSQSRILETQEPEITQEGSPQDRTINPSIPAEREATSVPFHRSAVDSAINEGKPVPSEVLADYPDLQKPSTEQAASPQTPTAERAPGIEHPTDGLRQFEVNGKVFTENADQSGAQGGVMLVTDANGTKGWVRATDTPISTVPRSAPATPREVIEAAGLVYLGEQQLPKGGVAHMFNVGNHTFMIRGEVTPETLRAKLAERGIPVVPQEPGTQPSPIIPVHSDPVVQARTQEIIQHVENADLGNLSAAIQDAPPEVRAQLQGLTAEIAKEQSASTSMIPRTANPELPQLVNAVPQGTQMLLKFTRAEGSVTDEQLRSLFPEYHVTIERTYNVLTPEFQGVKLTFWNETGTRQVKAPLGAVERFGLSKPLYTGQEPEMVSATVPQPPRSPITKELTSATTETTSIERPVEPSGQTGPEVPRPDQSAENGPAGVSRVPGEPGASDVAASGAGRPLETWADVNAEVQRRIAETGILSPRGGGQSGAVGPGANAPFDPLRFPKGGLPDHAKILHILDPVLTKLKMDAANLVAAGKLKAEEVSAYIRDTAKDLFTNDPFYSKWNPVNKRAGIAIVARETVPPSSSMDGVRSIVKKARDLGGIEPIPQMSTAGIGGEGREHASARISVPFVVRDLLSRVFPDQYADSDAMSKTVDIIVKDNILDGYDTFMRRGMDAQVKAATAEAAEKAAVKHRKALDKNPPAGLTPKDIGQLKMAANNAISKAHDDAISFRREAVGWLKDADAIQARPDFTQMESDVNAAKSDPKMVANIGRWLAEVNPEMDQLYNEAKRIDPNTPQPGRGRVFGARVNLLPETRAAEMAAYSDPNSPMPESVTSNYRNPNVKRDPFMKEAKFTGQYSSDAQAVLTNSFGSRMNEVTKIRLVDAITSRGLGVELGPGEKPPDLIQGQKPVRLSLKMPVTNENGTTTIAERSLWIRPDLAREVRDVLNTDMALPSSKVYRFLTQIQLAQLTDITAHLKNVVTRLASAPMTKSAFTDAVRQLPLVGHVDALRQIVSVTRDVISDSPAIRAEMAKIAQEGYIRPEYPAQGIQTVPVVGKVFRGGQQLIHTVDTAARISLYRAFDQLVASGRVTDTPENRAQYIQAIGEYNRRLMSPIMRVARDYGASPFVVAGKSFNRLGIRMVTGNPSVEASSNTEAAKMRAVNLATGLVAASVLPAMLNLATTGSLGGRPGTPMGAWDMGRPEDETGKHRVIDLFQILGIRRGLRATGANAAIEGMRQGQSVNEITGHMGEDIVQARLHPWLGPGVGFGITALSGKRFDLRSSPTPIIAKNVGGGAQYAENARVALENQNPLLYAVLSPALGPAEGQEDDSLLARMRKGLLKGPASAFGVQDLKSPALKYLDEKIGATMPQVTATGERQTASKSITTKERAGQSAADDIRRAREEGILSVADVSRLRKAGKLTALEAKIENIHRGYGVEGVLDFYERFANDLTPEERNGVQRILRRAKITIASHPLNQRGTAAQKAERMTRLNKALSAPAVPAQP